MTTLIITADYRYVFVWKFPPSPQSQRSPIPNNESCLCRYVLLVATASTFIPSYHTHLTDAFRVKSGVPYPNAYATASDAAISKAKFRFNCAQRAHANFTENYTSFVCLLLISGLNYPKLSSFLGGLWCIARLLYLLGYTRKENAENGKGRHWGSWWAVPHILLMCLAISSSLKTV
jgi:glutathione S-transferase